MNNDECYNQCHYEFPWYGKQAGQKAIFSDRHFQLIRNVPQNQWYQIVLASTSELFFVEFFPCGGSINDSYQKHAEQPFVNCRKLVSHVGI